MNHRKKIKYGSDPLKRNMRRVRKRKGTLEKRGPMSLQ